MKNVLLILLIFFSTTTLAESITDAAFRIDSIPSKLYSYEKAVFVSGCILGGKIDYCNNLKRVELCDYESVLRISQSASADLDNSDEDRATMRSLVRMILASSSTDIVSKHCD